MATYLLWYIVSGLLLLIEAFTPGLFIFVCFAMATLITGIVDQISDLNLEQLLILNLVLSILFLIFIKPLLKLLVKIPKSEEMLYANKLVGQEGMVFRPITKTQIGAVKLFDVDEIWLAKSDDGSEIGQGTTVKVDRVDDGNHLIIKTLY